MDTKITKRNINIIERNEKNERMIETERKKLEANKEKNSENIIIIENPASDNDIAEDDDPVFETRRAPKRKNMSGDEINDLKGIIETADRFSMSDMATAHIVNAAIGADPDSLPEKPLYRKKVARLRTKLRTEALADMEGKEPIAIGFDERRDKGRVVVGESSEGTKRVDTKTVENCSIVFWPGPEYAGHVEVKEGTGKGLARYIYNF